MRFPEFTDEWKRSSLGEVTTFVKERIGADKLTRNNYVSTENMNPDFGGINQASSVPNNTNVIHYQKGDVLLSNIRPYLRKVWAASSDGGCSADVFVFRAKSISSSFLHYIMANDTFINYVMSGAKGVKMPRGDKEQILKYIFSTPNIEEQNKISHLLHLLDERVSTQNKIIGDLKKLKSAIVDKLMTPQKEWKSTKIGNVLSIGSGRDYKHLEDGNIPVYGTGGYMLSVDSYLYDGESVCIGRKGTINKPIFLKGKFWTVDTLFYTHTFRSITPRFCYYLFTTIDWLKYNEASGVPSLSKVAIENISISIPDLVTQKQICAVLDSMTDKLDIEQKSLDAYRAQKQYLLQQMFI